MKQLFHTMKKLHMINYISMSPEQKSAHVTSLHLMRDELLKNSKKVRRVAGVRKKRKPMKFTSPELEAIFHTMPPECQRLILEGE